MICYRDRTYCASPNCKNACGRKLTPEVEEAAKKADLPLSLGWFCGGAAEGLARSRETPTTLGRNDCGRNQEDS